MPKKILLTLAAFVVVCVCVLGAGFLAEPNTGVHAIAEGSTCPVAGCSGECHGYDNVPMPEGSVEMICPETACSSVECHAWETLRTGYRQASDASLNLWILAPVALTVALVALVYALSRREEDLAESGEEVGDR